MSLVSMEAVLTGIGIMVTIHLAFAGWVVTNARNIASSIDRMTLVLNKMSERLAITETTVSHIAKDVRRLEAREERMEEDIRGKSK